MPLSRNRKLSKNHLARTAGVRMYRRVIHRAYVAMLQGAMPPDAYKVFVHHARRRLLLGKLAGAPTVEVAPA